MTEEGSITESRGKMELMNVTTDFIRMIRDMFRHDLEEMFEIGI